MHQQGIPGSPPPATGAPGDNGLGPQAGIQSKERWAIGQKDDRPVLTAMRAPSLWRITLHGENVYFRISWGSSSAHAIDQIEPPGRFVVPGSVDIYARPISFDAPAHAEVTLTPATSGSSAILHRHFAGVNQPIDPEAARFVAMVASVVRVGPVGSSYVMNLNPLDSTPLVAGSLLTSGGGYLEYEP